MKKLKIILFVIFFYTFFLQTFSIDKNLIIFLENELKKERDYFEIFEDYKIPKIVISEDIEPLKIFFRGKHYANGIKINSDNNYIIFNADYSRLIQWPYNIIVKYQEIDQRQINIPVYLFDKINERRFDDPIFLNAYQTQYGEITEGFSIEDLKKEFLDNLFLLDGVSFFAKDQLESITQIDFLNKLNKTDKFNYLGDPSNPSYKCYFFAIANVLDFYFIKNGFDINKRKYINFLNGKTEFGTDPRFLELCYRYFSKRNFEFKVLSPFFFKDPITSESVTYSLEAASKIPLLFDLIPEKLKDSKMTQRSYNKNNFSYFNKFSKRTDVSNYNFEKIKSIIKNGNVLLGGIGMRYYGSELKASTHAVMICGFFEYKKMKMLVYKDNYGEEKMFKMLPVKRFKELYLYKNEMGKE